MCRWALISWPIEEKTPRNLYLILGEIYDKDIRTDITKISEFYRDLLYFYPFRFSVKENICYNAEDIFSLQKKYGLTVRHQLVGNTDKEILSLRTPILYDISCMVPLFVKNNRIIYKQKKDTVCIVLSYSDPIVRGKLLKEVLEYGPMTFVLTGDKYGKNKDSTATLASRYLLTCKVPSECIIKINQDKTPDCILEAIEIVNMTVAYTDYDIIIACQSENIHQTVRSLKKKGILQYRKFRYLCPFG